MKKTIIILAFAMAAMFCVLLTGCGSSGGGEDLSDSEYIGTWKAVSMSMGDEKESVEGMEATLTLNGDGTGTLVSADEENGEETSEFTWEPTDEGFKTKGDVKMKFTYDGKQLHGKVTIATLDFEKQ